MNDYLQAIDARTGQSMLSFGTTIPHPGEYGYETLPPDAYEYVGGANTWGEISVDEERGTRALAAATWPSRCRTEPPHP